MDIHEHEPDIFDVAAGSEEDVGIEDLARAVAHCRVERPCRGLSHNGMPVRRRDSADTIRVGSFRVVYRHPGWVAYRQTTAGEQIVTNYRGEPHVWPGGPGSLRPVVAELAKTCRTLLPPWKEQEARVLDRRMHEQVAALAPKQGRLL